MFRYLGLVAVILLVTFPTVAESEDIAFGISSSGNFSWHYVYAGNWEILGAILNEMEESAEVHSIRFGVTCATLDNEQIVARVDTFFNMCMASNIEIVFMLGYGCNGEGEYIDRTAELGCDSAPVKTECPVVDEYWENYILTIMSLWGDQIVGYEIWNEPNYIDDFFYGMVDDYIHMFQVANNVIKGVYPDAKICSAGLGTDQAVLAPYMEKLFGPGGIHEICDAIGLHMYAENAYRTFKTYFDVCENNNIAPKPIWVTEFGRALWESGEKVNTENGARAYSEQILEQFEAYGVNKAFWFTFVEANAPYSLFYVNEETNTLFEDGKKWEFYCSATAKFNNSFQRGTKIGFGENDQGGPLFGVSPFETYLAATGSDTAPVWEQSAFDFGDPDFEWPISSHTHHNSEIGDLETPIAFDVNDAWVWAHNEVDEIILTFEIKSDGDSIVLMYENGDQNEFTSMDANMERWEDVFCIELLGDIQLETTVLDFQTGVDSVYLVVEEISLIPGEFNTIVLPISDWTFQNGLTKRADIKFVPVDNNKFEIRRIEISPVMGGVVYEDKSAETQLQYSGQPYNAMPLNYDGDEFKDLFISRYDDFVLANKGVFFGSSGAPQFVEREDILPGAIPAGTTGMVSADFDNDGWIDFFATNPTNGGRLYRNINGEYFSDWTTESGLSALFGSDDDICSCSWADYDGDGFLDLTVISGEPVFSGLLKVFHNTGGAFESTTIEGYSGFTPLWADYDNDGDLDLISLQSYEHSLSEPFIDYNIFYINQGDGTFINEAWDRIGSTASYMGYTISVVVDIDNDGDFDIVYAEAGGAIYILENNNLGYFSPPYITNLTSSGYPTDIAVFDYDLDGFQDVIVGYSSGPDGQSPTSVYLLGNRLSTTGHRLLVDETLTAGLTGTTHFAGIAPADFNRDGFSDIYLSRVSNESFFFKGKPAANELQNNWVGFSLQSPAGANNSTGIGARVDVTAGSKSFSQTVDGGSGLASQHESDLVFGLGAYWGQVSVQVTWPNGRIQSQTDVSTKQYHSIIDNTLVVDDSSVDFQIRYHVNSSIQDWVFTWETYSDTEVARDKVYFDLSGVPESCPPGLAEIHEQINGVDVVITPLEDGKYQHCLTFLNVECESRCTIPYTVESGAGAFSSVSSSRNIKIKTCLVGP